jgi:hypothetical protein
MMSRGRRLVVVAIGLLAIALLGAFAGIDSAAAASVTQPVAGALPSEAAAAPCVGQGVAGADAASTQQTANHAGLVIVFPKGRVETRCIDFTGDSITGTELLQQSDLPIVFAGFGGLGGGVCRIDDVGCSDPGDCFCQCQGANCAYWSYFALEDGTWTYLSLGPAQHHVHDGDVDGWVWGNGHTVPGDARGPCPTTPTPAPTTGAPPSTPTLSGGGLSSGGQIDTPSAPAAMAGTTPQPSAVTSATSRPTQLVRAAETSTSSQARADLAGRDRSGGGTPIGLIAFGVVAGLLVAGIGGLALRRRFGG